MAGAGSRKLPARRAARCSAACFCEVAAPSLADGLRAVAPEEAGVATLLTGWRCRTASGGGVEHLFSGRASANRGVATAAATSPREGRREKGPAGSVEGVEHLLIVSHGKVSGAKVSRDTALQDDAVPIACGEVGLDRLLRGPSAAQARPPQSGRNCCTQGSCNSLARAFHL